MLIKKLLWGNKNNNKFLFLFYFLINLIVIHFRTMNYKYKKINKDDAIKALGKKQVNLKIIPDVNWSPKIAQVPKINIKIQINIKYSII